MDYHGIRAPYFIKTQSALDNMRPDLKKMYAWIYQQLEEDFRISGHERLNKIE